MFHRRLLARALIALAATATVYGGGEAEPQEAAAGAGGAAQQALTATGDQWPNAAFKTGDFVYATPAAFTAATGHEITSYQEAPELRPGSPPERSRQWNRGFPKSHWCWFRWRR